MVVPALPNGASLFTAGETLTHTDMNAVRALQEWERDTKPLFTQLASASQSIAPNTLTAYEFSDGSGAFDQAVQVNQGGWTAQNGGTSLVVPETGYYDIAGNVVIDSPTSTTTRFEVFLYDNDAATPIRTVIFELNANIGTLIPTYSGNRFFTAGDRIDLMFQHDNGLNLGFRPYFTAYWINS